MNEELLKEIEQMSAEEKQALLNTQFPEELEKAAEAELRMSDLADALYAYGAYTADREVEEVTGDLSKEASAEFDAAEAEIVQAMDSAVADLGLADIEDSVELHKQAQAAAAIMLSGYADQLEKIAEDEEAAKAPGKMEKLKAWVAKQKAKASEMASKAKGAVGSAAGKAKGHVGAHAGKYGLLGGAAAGALGAGLAMKAMQGQKKKASEASVQDIADEVRSQMAAEELAVDGVEKIAGLMSAKGGKLKKALEGAKKHVSAHSGKYGLGAGGVAGAAAAKLHSRMAKKEK